MNIIEEKMADLIRLCKKYRIAKMYVFGSVNTTSFNPASDIDFLISFDNGLSIEEYTENYFELQYDLRGLFSREIDLVTENSLTNPYLIRGIDQTKRLVYAA